MAHSVLNTTARAQCQPTDPPMPPAKRAALGRGSTPTRALAGDDHPQVGLPPPVARDASPSRPPRPTFPTCRSQAPPQTPSPPPPPNRPAPTQPLTPPGSAPGAPPPPPSSALGPPSPGPTSPPPHRHTLREQPPKPALQRRVPPHAPRLPVAVTGLAPSITVHLSSPSWRGGRRGLDNQTRSPSVHSLSPAQPGWGAGHMLSAQERSAGE